MTRQLILYLDLNRRDRAKLHHVLKTKASRLNQQLHQLNRYRIVMRRIEIKIATTDEQILRVGCFENQQSAGFECSADLVKKPDQRLQRQVFGKVKRRDRIQATFLEFPQIS